MQQEHPFAHYIKALGKGKNGARALTQDEAEAAMGMILRDEVEPAQLGAFMMLMRVKEETPEEVAGFVKAVRHSLALPDGLPTVDLDWSSYAGKRRHLPWFILSVLLLAQQGVRVLMHGTSGHTAGRLYTREILAQLGFPAAESLTQAGEQLTARHFAYIDLSVLSPRLQQIMDMRSLFGLRTPVHTVARMLNPLGARHVMQGIFHPGYQMIHQGAAVCLGEQEVAIIKGEGGEIERNPDAPCTVYGASAGTTFTEQWPAIYSQRHVRPETLELTELRRLWRGDYHDEYAQGAVVGTLAVALRLLGRADSPSEALAQAEALWDSRDKVAL